MKALVSGTVFNADYHQQWLASLQPEDPDQPDGQKYGYGISYQRFATNAAIFYHGGELPGFNSFMGYEWLPPSGMTGRPSSLAGLAATERQLNRLHQHVRQPGQEGSEQPRRPPVYRRGRA